MPTEYYANFNDNLSCNITSAKIEKNVLNVLNEV